MNASTPPRPTLADLVVIVVGTCKRRLSDCDAISVDGAPRDCMAADCPVRGALLKEQEELENMPNVLHALCSGGGP